MLVWMALGMCFVAHAQPQAPSAPEQYIAEWSDEAVYQMAVHGIPASITLAQGILESGSGRSELAAKSNNHFGIKCHSDWDGERVYHDDDRRGECFRSYDNASESFHDHSEFLKRSRYEALFELKPTDYVRWAKGLKKCGYATNPKYAHLLIDLIERYDLAQYDEQGLALQADREAFAAADAAQSTARNEVLETVQNKELNPAKSANTKAIAAFKPARITSNTSWPNRETPTMPSRSNWTLWAGNSTVTMTSTAKTAPTPRRLARSSTCSPSATVAEALWLEMRPEETIWEAAQRSGVSVKCLVRKNRLTPESPGLQTEGYRCAGA